MANQAKPDVNTIWGSAGLAKALSKAKQALGWVAEIPEYDEFNGMLQQISQFQQHVNQEGVALWDALTTYGVGSVVKSPVDRSLYRALAADLLNVAPIAVAGGAVNANWVKLAHTNTEIQALIGLYGVTAANLQAQAVIAFTSAGVAPTLTLTPNPAIAAYVANQRFRVKFNVASLPGVNTLNISGKGALALKQYDATGAKINASFSSGQLSDAEYDGVDILLLNPLPTPTVDASATVKGVQRNATLAETKVGASAVLTVTPSTLSGVAAFTQTLTEFPTGRALNTNYVNNTNKAIFVTVRVATTSGSIAQNRIGIRIDGLASFYGNGTAGSGVGYSISCVAVVQPGETYRAEISNATLLDWTER